MSEDESSPTGSETQEPAKAAEESPVLDVHVPHTTHTWKDFWIHLGTITIGLLIAVSLEQSVEWVHRLHEGHVLEEDLREEGRKNQAIIAFDIGNNDARLGWLTVLLGDVDRMRASGGKLKLAYRSFEEVDPKGAAMAFTTPFSTVWETAKADATVGLLRKGDARLYTLVYREAEASEEAGKYLIGVQLERSTFEARFNAGTTADSFDRALNPSGRPDLSKMTVPELDEYSALLTKDLMAQRASRRRLLILEGGNTALLSGATTVEQVVDASVAAMRAHASASGDSAAGADAGAGAK